MTKSKQKYDELVGLDGAKLATRTLELLTNYSKDLMSENTFYSQLLNAYWRGKAQGIREVREIVNQRT